ncbi:MaoC/PaaZ C-terminal domain-containing protein [Bradymonas sediminis]|uniref:Uncharacterized protein n=1 Tax=Bradymonas sediminis TaxID=1548548 RepID=A0A2Z4FRE7_9DELT|nr:MaoC/PaaZ C-terminal domain-containing protein [Bradymonas sediminis]AWV91226.1 hypothetical protein DN745_18600 [Bradymonas sediminis]TDP73793.1 MaoC dehydratase-like protein [Bradymonas sediminis]
MAVPNRYIWHQAPVIAGLLKTAARALKQRLPGSDFRAGQNPPLLPGPVLRHTVKALPSEVVASYIAHMGADGADYRRILPPHLLPQWALPLAMETLAEIPYPLMRIVNGGCRLEINAALPANKPLDVSAQLLDIDDNGRRAVMHTKVVTGTATAPEALVGHFYWIVAGAKSSGDTRPTQKQSIPDQARELERWYLPKDSGLNFARLTGDFNPIHWLAPHARAFGFDNVILHGFEAQGRAFEALSRELAKTNERLAVLDLRFTRPLTLPAEVGLYIDSDSVYLGRAPGARAYLVGTFERAAREQGA